MVLSREWDDLVGHVRSLGPGFADFLRPPRLSSLIPAVGTGTMVLVNVTSTRCDALLVEASGVHALPLPRLSADETAERVLAHIRRLRSVEAASARVQRTAQRAQDRPSFAAFQDHRTAKQELRTAEEELDVCLLDDLRWLWDTIAEPVLEAAASNRIWWCPSARRRSPGSRKRAASPRRPPDSP
ncbi:hypothetical protein E6W39_00870 [Kitasatospora acidiphila]|uniref:Uncharacterized protein n=1 Tax=Kitasatospora acidiphila TaxID=2567942 RepID=A0A540WHK6_9ACTN|nr:hypothetical protein [Kitasatospora acidiphila]TQF07924.1 hypothetical protein E6W39_00870 [Kitasatospora acidiphila]